MPFSMDLHAWEHQPERRNGFWMIVDITIAGNPNTLVKFCHAYRVVGYDLALAAFKDGYDETDPSAEEVFREAVSRCA
ncbi:MAG TPA: hypothetical protein VF944_11595 [Candidatus Bathyarchaeia archaeon]